MEEGKVVTAWHGMCHVRTFCAQLAYSFNFTIKYLMSCASAKEQSHRVGRISLRHTHYAKVVNNYGVASCSSLCLFPSSPLCLSHSLAAQSGLQHLSNALTLVARHEGRVTGMDASVIACLLVKLP